MRAAVEGIRPLTRAAAAAAAIAAALALTAPATATAKRAPDGFFGVSPAVIVGVEELATMKRARIETIRYPFFWPILQTEPRNGRQIEAVLNWERYDPLLVEAARKGIRILPYVYGTPEFLTGDPTVPPIRSAKYRSEWKRLLRALQERYGPGGELWEDAGVDPEPIKAWQIWNEPSSAAYWKHPRRSPREYARLLEISDRVLDGRGGGGRRAARAGGGGKAKIVAAGIFGSPTHGIDMTRFFQRFYDVRGVKKHFDVVALHPYAPSTEGTKLQLTLGRSYMKAAGDGDTPLWITEVGWPTEGSPENPYYTTPKQQAGRLRRVFNYALRKRDGWNIERVYWYTWRDNGVNPNCDLCRYAGLFDIDLNPKPSWGEFVSFTGGRP